MKRWGLRLVLVAAMAFAVAPGSSVWADDHGLYNACEGPAADNNPNCAHKDDPGHNGGSTPSLAGDFEDGDDGDKKNKPGSNNPSPPPNEPGDDMQTRVAGCFEDGNDADDRPDGCDSEDNDEDLVPNQFDNCADRDNTTQRDNDGDGIGNRCDPYVNDSDHDGVDDEVDNCPDDPNPSQVNSDEHVNGGDTNGDACDSDMGNNGVPDSYDDEYATVYGNTVGKLPVPDN